MMLLLAYEICITGFSFTSSSFKYLNCVFSSGKSSFCTLAVLAERHLLLDGEFLNMLTSFFMDFDVAVLVGPLLFC